MRISLLSLLALAFVACSNSPAEPQTNNLIDDLPAVQKNKALHFRGAFSNGMKGDSLSFDLSADGKQLSNLTFKGYWRCNGRLEILPAAGPDGSFLVVNGKVKGHISEPPGGGSTAWRFDLDCSINGKKATGTFRMNINNLGCDSYLLKFEAVAK